MKPKLTLLICTYNGERTIQTALECIAAQTDIALEDYEVLVVNNASSDRTAEIATATIEKLTLNGRVLLEPKIGKVNALLRGLHEANSELISIIDDDNFIEPGFICHTLAVFEQYADVVMVGSKNSLFINQPIPAWFEWARGNYACAQPMLDEIEEQHPCGIVVAKSGVMAGAGSTFRAKPLRDCLEKGYRFFNDTQRGKNMKVTGEDLELCWLMRSLGYRFAFDPRIQVRHAIKPERLSLQYFRLLCKTQGAGSPGADPFMFTYKCQNQKFPLQWTWQWQFFSKLKRYFRAAFLSMTSGSEEARFRHWIAKVECVGAMQQILTERGKYTQHIHQVAAGSWTELRVR